jgi:predicted dehydrogenase
VDEGQQSPEQPVPQVSIPPDAEGTPLPAVHLHDLDPEVERQFAEASNPPPAEPEAAAELSAPVPEPPETPAETPLTPEEQAHEDAIKLIASLMADHSRSTVEVQPEPTYVSSAVPVQLAEVAEPEVQPNVNSVVGPAPLRIAVLGAGRRGTALAHAAARLPGVSIAAVADDAYARAFELSSVWNADSYGSWQSLLNFQRFDAVVIASPAHVHAEQTLIALGRQMHVYVDRPPAIDAVMAQRVAEAVLADPERIVHVGLQHRYSSLIEPLRWELHGKKVSLVAAHVYRGLPGSLALAEPSRTGGQVVDEALPLIDLCRWLVGEITSVAAHMGSAIADTQHGWSGADSVAATFRFATGAAGSLATTYAMPLPVAGHLALDFVLEGATLVRFTGAEVQVVDATGTRNWSVLEPPDLPAMAAFIEAVRTGDRSGLRISYPEAQQSLRVALAINEAALSGTVVLL